MNHIEILFHFTDTCYTDFSKLTGNILSLLFKILTARDCAFQCQMNSGHYFYVELVQYAN